MFELRESLQGQSLSMSTIINMLISYQVIDGMMNCTRSSIMGVINCLIPSQESIMFSIMIFVVYLLHIGIIQMFSIFHNDNVFHYQLFDIMCVFPFNFIIISVFFFYFYMYCIYNIFTI